MAAPVPHGGGVSGKKGCTCEPCKDKSRQYRRQRMGVEAPNYNPRRLTYDEVMEIKRALYVGEKQHFLAEKYNVTQTTISNIKIKKHWKNVRFHPTAADRKMRDSLKKHSKTRGENYSRLAS